MRLVKASPALHRILASRTTKIKIKKEKKSISDTLCDAYFVHSIFFTNYLSQLSSSLDFLGSGIRKMHLHSNIVWLAHPSQAMYS